MEVIKCLEYYFEEGTSTEEIIQYVQKNIDELKKTSKIKEAKTNIITNEYGAKIARLTLTIEERDKKVKKVKETKNKGPLYNNLSEDFQNICISKMMKDKIKEKQEKKLQKQQEKKQIQQMQKRKKQEEQERMQQEKENYQKTEEKAPIIKEEKKEQTKAIANPIVKIEMEVPVRKYGAYKEGGKFTPYQPKKKKKFLDIIRKRKEND